MRRVARNHDRGDRPLAHPVWWVRTIIVAPELEPEQAALFEIEGPDEDGCVWACAPQGPQVWCRNLGPKDKVIEVLLRWLAEVGSSEESSATRN